MRFDVVVVGGGVAGVTAAIASARSGAETALIDSRPFVGGNATTGLAIHTYFTHRGEQVVHGIPDEYVARLTKDGRGQGHLPYGGVVDHVTPVDGDAFRALVTEMLAEAGVTVMYQTMALDVNMEAQRVRSLRAARKGGIVEIEASLFVDTSGDGDVAVAAGADFRLGRGGGDSAMLPVSMLLRCYGTDNAAAARAIAPDGPIALGHTEDGKEFPAYFLGNFASWNDELAELGLFPSQDHRGSFITVWPDELNVNTSMVMGVDATDPRELATATVDLTRQVAEIGRFLRAHVPGFEKSRWIPAIVPGVRETRHIVGIDTLEDADALEGRKNDATIGRSCFPIDILDPETGQATITDIGGDGSFDIPYGSLVAAKVENVLMAGRSISASHVANGSTRVMAGCMVTGQAAGTAAALASQANGPAAEVEVRALQGELERQGVFLG